MPINDLAQRATEIGDRLCIYKGKWPAEEIAIASDLDHEKNIVFIHGFASHGNFMKDMVQFFLKEGFTCLLFNYHSYRGIEIAAKSLNRHLVNLLKEIQNEEHKAPPESPLFALVGHSMGGLVARALVHNKVNKNSEISSHVSKLVTLGSPHNGTLENDPLLKVLLMWAQWITKQINDVAKFPLVAKFYQSLEQLRSQDKFLTNLNQRCEISQSIPILSISGGRRWIEVGSSIALNVIVNRRVQKKFGDEHRACGNPDTTNMHNDGLVLESSSDVSRVINSWHPKLNHWKDYVDYPDINHSHLIDCSAIFQEIAEFLKPPGKLKKRARS